MNDLRPATPPAVPVLADVTARLRLIRTVSQQRRYKGRPTPTLPSKRIVDDIVQDTVGLLYPRHFGPEGLTAADTDGFVARNLASVMTRLAQQVRLELLLAEDAREGQCSEKAAAIAQDFVQGLVRVRDIHDTDIGAAYDSDPSARSLDEIIFCFPGSAAILRHRIAHDIHRLGAPMLARIMAELSHSRTAIDIHPGAQIGPAFFIDHGTGVVIGETARIGRNVRLYQNVTLGAKRFEADENGVLIKGQPRHPVVEDDVVIYAGATVLGRITIGKGSVIGGGVWLTRSVMAGSVVSQANAQLEGPPAP
ncbi:serine O-acetyltransferase [Paragemmobacter straminiformis]|uniref:serine O-acetyltransferase n=1 Tax=Paragemmobacter straminiformis TaxID=2045119 RepID=A0A842IBQ6_9RHOB|nr:serine O-acetyltransferase [Gemmobacter straminiformis]MBC2836843.1 serine acetyltransferase [Gemmobacter straminiformis]